MELEAQRSALVEQSAAAIDSLKAQAQDLVRAVSVCRIDAAQLPPSCCALADRGGSGLQKRERMVRSLQAFEGVLSNAEG